MHGDRSVRLMSTLPHLHRGPADCSPPGNVSRVRRLAEDRGNVVDVDERDRDRRPALPDRVAGVADDELEDVASHGLYMGG